MMKKPEILAPAGSMEKLKFALRFGADAVYLGGSDFSLRAQGKNFGQAELTEAVHYVHEQGKKVYVTVNIYPHEDDLTGLADYLRFLESVGADAALVSDLGIFTMARQVAPKLPLHVSTQANTLNSAAVNAWAAMGAERVVLGREVSLEELKKIRAATNVELEMFVHGAMCVSYSGRCLLSNFLTGRDANRGSCTQPCRWKYALVEEKRPGQYFPVEEDARGTYIFNSKDLALLSYVGQLSELGVDSLKIEGRMKSVHYAATVANTYRRAVDDYFDWRSESAVLDGGAVTNIGEWAPAQSMYDELEKISHRRYSLGFLKGRPDMNGQVYNTSVYEQSTEFIGVVLSCDEDGNAVIEQRNNFRVGENIEFFPPEGEIFSFVPEKMADGDNNDIQVAPHARQIVKMKLPKQVPDYTILRRILVENKEDHK